MHVPLTITYHPAVKSKNLSSIVDNPTYYWHMLAQTKKWMLLSHVHIHTCIRESSDGTTCTAPFVTDIVLCLGFAVCMHPTTMFISNRRMSSIMQGMIVVYDEVVFVTANGWSMMLLLQYDNISSLKYNLIQFHLLYFHMSLMYRVSSSWMTSFQYARVHMNKSGNLAAELNRDAVTTATTTTFITGSHSQKQSRDTKSCFLFPFRYHSLVNMVTWNEITVSHLLKSFFLLTRTHTCQWAL